MGHFRGILEEYSCNNIFVLSQVQLIYSMTYKELSILKTDLFSAVSVYKIMNIFFFRKKNQILIGFIAKSIKFWVVFLYFPITLGGVDPQ